MVKRRCNPIDRPWASRSLRRLRAELDKLDELLGEGRPLSEVGQKHLERHIDKLLRAVEGGDETPATASAEVADINRALLEGTLGLTESGVARIIPGMQRGPLRPIEERHPQAGRRQRERETRYAAGIAGMFQQTEETAWRDATLADARNVESIAEADLARQGAQPSERAEAVGRLVAAQQWIATLRDERDVETARQRFYLHFRATPDVAELATLLAIEFPRGIRDEERIDELWRRMSQSERVRATDSSSLLVLEFGGALDWGMFEEIIYDRMSAYGVRRTDADMERAYEGLATTLPLIGAVKQI